MGDFGDKINKTIANATGKKYSMLKVVQRMLQLVLGNKSIN